MTDVPQGSRESERSGADRAPIFFPFTCLPPGAAGALRSCFAGLTLVSPIAGGTDTVPPPPDDWLDIRSPAGVEGDTIRAVIRQYHGWAELHQGRRGIDRGLPQSDAGKTPFWQDTAPSRIRDAIRRLGNGVAETVGTPELINDLVFLGIAEQHDIQSFGIQETFKDLAHQEAELFDELRGDNAIDPRPLSSVHPTPADPGGYMTGERLQAWVRVSRRIFAEAGPPPAAVTTSRAVVETVADRAETLVQVARFDAIPCGRRDEPAMGRWRSQLADYLKILARGNPAPLPLPPEPGADEACAGLTLYVAPGLDLFSFLALAAGEPLCSTAREGTGQAVIGLIHERA